MAALGLFGFRNKPPANSRALPAPAACPMSGSPWPQRREIVRQRLAERRMAHAERIENMPLHIGGLVFSRNAFDDISGERDSIVGLGLDIAVGLLAAADRVELCAHVVPQCEPGCSEVLGQMAERR